MRVRIIPPVWFLLTLVLMYLADRFMPLAEVFPNPSNLAGLAPALAGALLAAIAANEFRKAETTVRPFEESSALVISGPFRFTRNPMYLGMVITLCGIAMVLGSLSSWLPVPAFGWLIQTRFVVREEQIMSEKFGDDYQKYRQRVRRWF